MHRSRSATALLGSESLPRTRCLWRHPLFTSWIYAAMFSSIAFTATMWGKQASIFTFYRFPVADILISGDSLIRFVYHICMSYRWSYENFPLCFSFLSLRLLKMDIGIILFFFLFWGYDFRIVARYRVSDLSIVRVCALLLLKNSIFWYDELYSAGIWWMHFGCISCRRRNLAHVLFAKLEAAPFSTWELVMYT